MSNETETPPARTTFWSRFWYFTAWRIVGILLLGLATRNFLSEEWSQGVLAAIFGVTYVVLLPANLVNMFHFGYSTGASDALTYAVSNDDRSLRHGLHPAEAAAETRLRERARRHAK